MELIILNKVKVVVVDDSALMRKIIADMINEEIDMEVIEVCRNGKDLIDKLDRLTPDVITLDVEMPIMDGVSALKNMKKMGKNTPVIMLSSLTYKGAVTTIECLEAGAFDFIGKPSGSISLDINKVKDELVSKIRMATSRKVPSKIIPQVQRKEISNKTEAVVIGASTGGPKALTTVISALPKKLGFPILIVQHMPVGFTKAFANRLNNTCNIKVVEAEQGQMIEEDTVYIAPGGYHMEVSRDKKINLTLEPAIWGVRPAVDKLFISAAKVYNKNLVSIVLTGMGKDGADGSIKVKDNGGFTVAEHESTCTIYGMPKSAIETGIIDEILPLGQVPSKIIKCSMVR